MEKKTVFTWRALEENGSNFIPPKEKTDKRKCIHNDAVFKLKRKDCQMPWGNLMISLPLSCLIKKLTKILTNDCLYFLLCTVQFPSNSKKKRGREDIKRDRLHATEAWRRPVFICSSSARMPEGEWLTFPSLTPLQAWTHFYNHTDCSSSGQTHN